MLSRISPFLPLHPFLSTTLPATPPPPKQISISTHFPLPSCHLYLSHHHQSASGPPNQLFCFHFYLHNLALNIMAFIVNSKKNASLTQNSSISSYHTWNQMATTYYKTLYHLDPALLYSTTTLYLYTFSLIFDSLFTVYIVNIRI